MSDFLLIEGKKVPVYDPYTGEKNPYLKELIDDLAKRNKFAIIGINGFDVQVFNPFSGKRNPFLERYY